MLFSSDVSMYAVKINFSEWSDIGPYTCEYIVLWGSLNSSFQWMVSFNGQWMLRRISLNS